VGVKAALLFLVRSSSCGKLVARRNNLKNKN